MSEPKDLIWRNPAPHAQPTLAPSGNYVTFTGRVMPAPSPSPVTEVTEEMVEAGSKALSTALIPDFKKPVGKVEVYALRHAFRAGLIAALRVR